MDSDPEDCTASSRGVGVTNTQCFTSSPLPPLTLFPSSPVANFPSLKYFTHFKFVPLGFVEFGEGLTDPAVRTQTHLSCPHLGAYCPALVVKIPTPFHIHPW